jgi:homoserine kinase
MTNPDSVLVRVPATTANLGPGFDCLGLTLDIWNEVEILVVKDGLKFEIEGEGKGIIPLDESNLIYQSFIHLAKNFNKPIPDGLVIRSKNAIPVSSGLGSSAAAITAGILAARELLGLIINDHELIQQGTKIEGHADNLSACLLGGLTVTSFTDNFFRCNRYTPKSFPVLVALPEIKLSTSQSRAVLPTSVSLESAIFNISHTALLVCALSEGKNNELGTLMQDKLHQSFRLPHISGAADALQAAQNAGAMAAVLSGAGPGLIAFHDGDARPIKQAMEAAFKAVNVNVRFFYTHSINVGAQITH